MVRPLPADELNVTVEIVRKCPGGVSLQDIAAALSDDAPVRTLQYRLQRLVEEGQLVREGERRWTRYRLPAGEPEVLAKAAPVEVEVEFVTPVSSAGEEIRAYLRQPEVARKPVGYLQPFDDVNKSVSRLSANIPLIKGNFSPLSFTDVPRDTYTQAILGVYEMNRVELLRDVFIWAYERSAARYAAVRQSPGEPDPSRLKHRDALRTIVTEFVRACMD